MEQKYELELLGITYNQVEQGVYALILQQKGGSRRIPIIIGSAEAQSIECRLQEIITPRPLTHDLFITMMRSFGLRLTEVLVRRLPSGVFAADLVVTDGQVTRRIDSRSSDAIALAVRANVPIYTTAKVLEEAGFERPRVEDSSNESVTSKEAPVSNLARYSDAELQDALASAIEQEKYEDAAKIKDEIDRRLSENTQL